MSIFKNPLFWASVATVGLCTPVLTGLAFFAGLVDGEKAFFFTVTTAFPAVFMGLVGLIITTRR